MVLYIYNKILILTNYFIFLDNYFIFLDNYFLNLNSFIFKNYGNVDLFENIIFIKFSFFLINMVNVNPIFFIFLNLFFFLFYIYIYISSFYKNLNIFLINNIYIYTIFFTESEKELNNFDDLLLVVIIFIVLYFYSFFLFSIVFLTNWYIKIFLLSLLSLKLILILIPLNMIYDYGCYFTFYLRGGSTSSIFFYEITMDYLNLISYFLRILMQLVRLIFIIGTLCEFNEFYLNFFNFFFNFFFINTVYTNLPLLNQIFFFFIKFILEVIHLFFIFIAQFLAFNVVILWLVQFLFTTFFFFFFRKFFFFKKCWK